MTIADMSIADTILEQLGCHRFIIMTGAKTFVATELGVQFKLPARIARNGINSVVINLNDSDTYDTYYYKIRGVDVKRVGTEHNIYADELQNRFTSMTGLATAL